MASVGGAGVPKMACLNARAAKTWAGVSGASGKGSGHGLDSGAWMGGRNDTFDLFGALGARNPG